MNLMAFISLSSMRNTDIFLNAPGVSLISASGRHFHTTWRKRLIRLEDVFLWIAAPHVCFILCGRCAKEHTRERSWRETARYLGLEPDPEKESGLRLTRTKGEVISKWQQRTIKSIAGEEVIDLIRGIYARGAKIAANRTLAAIRKMFAWAVAEKMLAASPCAGAKPPAKEKMRRRVLKPDELRAVWKAADRIGSPAGAAYHLLILSGQRKSQVALARIEDFDLKERLWTIPPEREGTNCLSLRVVFAGHEMKRLYRLGLFSPLNNPRLSAGKNEITGLWNPNIGKIA